MTKRYTLNKMRKKRFRLICDDLFHEQYNSHKGYCYQISEPDYKKAGAMFQTVASTAIGLGLEPAVRAIVDAAYGNNK